MKIIGLTGQSGAGKALVCEILQRHGIPSVDTDAVYHKLLADVHPAMTGELTAAFGNGLLGTDGVVDRKRLAAAVYGHSDSDTRLHTLNAITHKYIMAKTWELVKGFEQGGARAAVIDAPQLFEAGLESTCDLVVAVLADEPVRLARVMARDGISKDAAERRFAAQRPDEFYRSHCQYVFENNGDANSLEAQILSFLEKTGLGV